MCAGRGRHTRPALLREVERNCPRRRPRAHAIKEEDVKTLCYRYQRTIARSVEIAGLGFLTGSSVRLRFRPAPPSTGVVFVRTDLTPTAHIPATIEQVTGTCRRTTLGPPPAQVTLVEHVLAALAGLRIDNCFVELNAPEPPGLDGSASKFVDVLQRAGVTLQSSRRGVMCTERPLVLEHGGANLSIHPTEDEKLRISYLLDYGPGSPIDRQIHSIVVTPETFVNSLADSRTFVLEHEAVEMRRQGIGTRISPSDLLVFGKHGPIDNRLRHADEPARHKILDIIGDLSLLGLDLRGHVVAYRSGHPLNIELARSLKLSLGNGCHRPECRPIAA